MKIRTIHYDSQSIPDRIDMLHLRSDSEWHAYQDMFIDKAYTANQVVLLDVERSIKEPSPIYHTPWYYRTSKMPTIDDIYYINDMSPVIKLNDIVTKIDIHGNCATFVRDYLLCSFIRSGDSFDLDNVVFSFNRSTSNYYNTSQPLTVCMGPYFLVSAISRSTSYSSGLVLSYETKSWVWSMAGIIAASKEEAVEWSESVDCEHYGQLEDVVISNINKRLTDTNDTLNKFASTAQNMFVSR
jgi:hypothetical protein